MMCHVNCWQNGRPTGGARDMGVPVIVITTPAGQIGRQVLGNLLQSGERLRVIARDPSQLPAEVRDDLDIIVGSHGD